MSQVDWAKKYAVMDKRLMLKYEQLPKGEQIGKKPTYAASAKKSVGFATFDSPLFLDALNGQPPVNSEVTPR